MLNKYQSNHVEFKRITKIIKAGMTPLEIEDVLNHNIYAYAKSLNIPHEKTRRVLSGSIHRFLLINSPVLPYIAKADKPTVTVCDGCRNAADVEGLRWDKMNRGEAVTWSIDRKNQPIGTEVVFSDNEIHRWFMAWASLTGNKVIQVKNGQIGDCHIKFDYIDGPGKVMGFVWQPRLGEEMQSGGRLPGDMTIDSSERSWPLPRTRRFGKHEAGHFFGLQHDDDPTSLMHGLLIGDHDVDPQEKDIAHWLMRYIDQRNTVLS